MPVLDARKNGAAAYELYHYTPSLVAAAISTSVFMLLTITHVYFVLRKRTWFCTAFVVGGLFETIGYIGRAIGHSNKDSLGPYVLQSILILVAPALFAATIYMTLGRVMRATQGEEYSIIRVTWLTKFFVTGDVFSFFVQGGGGGIMATGEVAKVKLGQNIILAGLFLQIMMFGLFILASVIWHVRMRKRPTPKSFDSDLRWERIITVLYTVSGTIMLRNIFRVVEYIQGRDGPLLRVEWPTYVFDALLMALAMALFLIGYPTALRATNGTHAESMECQPARTPFSSSHIKDEKHSQRRG